MFRRLPALAAGALAIAVAAPPALAHHSFAMFDQTKQQTLEGVVEEYRWMNPHSRIVLHVAGQGGQTQAWEIEGAASNIMARQGWTRNSLKQGDPVKIVVFPLRNGEPGGMLVRAIMADGRELWRNEYRR